jgi:hypothetical protein
MPLMLINLVVGLALLFLGRRLFWLFVAGVGFIVGAMLTTFFFEGQSELVTLLVAVGVGLVGAMISVFLQRALVAIAGFLAGGYVVYTLLLSLGYEPWAWMGFLGGGIVGGVLVLIVFHWALILLSSLIGSTVIVESLPLDTTFATVTFLGLCALGIFVQARQMSSMKSKPV